MILIILVSSDFSKREKDLTMVKRGMEHSQKKKKKTFLAQGKRRRKEFSLSSVWFARRKDKETKHFLLSISSKIGRNKIVGQTGKLIPQKNGGIMRKMNPLRKRCTLSFPFLHPNSLNQTKGFISFLSLSSLSLLP